MILGNLTPSECTQTLSILINQSLSGILDTVDAMLVALIQPAAWTAAALTLQGSVDGSTFFPITYYAAAAQFQWIGAANFAPGTLQLIRAPSQDSNIDSLPRYLKLRSGTDAAPVNQLVQRDFICILHPRHPWDLKQ